MPKPKRTENHIIDTKAKKHLEQHIPNEWFYTIPSMDYGIDYNVEIAINGQVSGLNFSIQLKGHRKSQHQDFAKATLKRSSLSYYKVRLEPVMVVVYEELLNQAYWIWIDDLDIDLTKPQKEYTIKVPKSNSLADLDWSEVLAHVQRVFNNRSFISDFDISKIHNDIELAAWKTYNDGDYEQAVYLFRKLIQEGYENINHHQALSWSLYRTYHYNEALIIINDLIKLRPSDNLFEMKACILAESGISQSDKGKILQARDLFKDSIADKSIYIVHYNYGNTLSALGDYETAINQYKICLKKNSNFAPCWKNLGTAFGELGDHEEEIKCYGTALSINPNLVEALFSMGISLAKDVHQYKEALVYFERALIHKSSFSMSFINGLYWVALSYQHVSDFSSSLYWLDYGLNFSGNNPYLLNLKRELLGSNWKEYPELKTAANDFFEYRLELDCDPRSLQHLILLRGLDLEAAFPLLQKYTPLFNLATLEDLKQLGFDLNMCLITVNHMRLCSSFKQGHLVTRYLDHLILDYYFIGDKFWNLLDIVTAYAFSMGVDIWLETKSSTKMNTTIFLVLTSHISQLIPFLVKFAKGLASEEKEFAMLNVVEGLKTVVYRETGAQSGYLSYKFKCDKSDPDIYISDEMSKRLLYNLLVASHEFKKQSNND